ncbi:PAS domain-containing sensor histidine kinase [Massilia agilis]|uniref:PAS domain-containing sensor histidine kinase n=1 Tax=Massilia agilis TaxID=1811226 RepID=A0ABT2DDF0_9BURK|nr:PAS domain-containing sensor histidine kinase [Massilia agilis]MCS0808461.1 PAS domain-containing sensor histidine kinase [Massilia agilis]
MNKKPGARSRGWGVAMFVLGCVGGAWFARQERRSGPRFSAHSEEIVNNASEAIITVDEDNQIVLANPSAAGMFLSTTWEMRGQPLTRYLHPPAGASGVVTTWFRASGSRAGRRGSDCAATGVRGSGQLFPIEGSISTSYRNGRPLHTIILRDVTERHMVQQKLSRSRDQLRQLSAALQTIREEERAYIARELHDDLGQILASLRMDLTLLQQADGNTPDSLKLMAGMENNLLTAITSLRRIATNLRPRALDEGGLYFALQGLRDDFVERHGIPASLFADEAELRLDDAASTAIFRIVQEALTNIARHANAHNVTMNLYRLNGELLIQIRDDGRGIRTEDMEKAESLGLIGMRERVWAMNGEITITSDEPPGTRIEIVLPLAGHTVD